MFPTLVALTALVVTGKFTDVAPAGTVTGLETVAAEFAFNRVTDAPPTGAAPVKLTVPVTD